MSHSSSKYTFTRPNCALPTPTQRILASVMNDVPVSMDLYLTSPADWPVFSQAFLAKARDLHIEEYLFHGKEIPTEPIPPSIPSSVVEEGPPLLINLTIEVTDDYDERIRRARGRSLEELEEFNAKLGKHNDSLRKFIAVRKNLDQLRLWTIMHVSPEIREKCLGGIQKGLGGSQPGKLHPSEWYAALAGCMDVWVRYDAARERYLAQWCRLFEMIESKAEPGKGRVQVEKDWFLDWIRDLIEIVRDARQREVREVMAGEQWLRRHLVGLGVIASVFGHEQEAVDGFVEEVEARMGKGDSGVNPVDILWRLHQLVEVSLFEEDMGKFLTITVIGGGGEGVVGSSRHGAAREECEKMKAELSCLKKAAAEAGAGLQVAVRSHVPKVNVRGSSPQSPEEKPDVDCLQGEPKSAETLLKYGEKTPEPGSEVTDVATSSSHEGGFISRDDTEQLTAEPAQQPNVESNSEDAPPSSPKKRRKRDVFLRLTRRACRRARAVFSKVR